MLLPVTHVWTGVSTSWNITWPIDACAEWETLLAAGGAWRLDRLTLFLNTDSSGWTHWIYINTTRYLHISTEKALHVWIQCCLNKQSSCKHTVLFLTFLLFLLFSSSEILGYNSLVLLHLPCWKETNNVNDSNYWFVNCLNWSNESFKSNRS